MKGIGAPRYYGASIVAGGASTVFFWWIGNLLAPPSWERAKTLAEQLIILFGFLLYGIPWGAWVSALFGFLLLAAALRFRWSQRWQWILWGTLLAPSLIWTVDKLAQFFLKTLPGGFAELFGTLVYFLIFMGPIVVLQSPLGIWMLLPAGAVTGGVLHWVHSSFAEGR